MSDCDDRKLLGDRLKAALERIGVGEEEVQRLLRRPCGCEERRRWLNQIHAWCIRVLAGRTDKAREYLDRIIGVDLD